VLFLLHSGSRAGVHAVHSTAALSQPSVTTIFTAWCCSVQDPTRAHPTGRVLFFPGQLHGPSPHPSPALTTRLHQLRSIAAPATGRCSPRLPGAALLPPASLPSPGQSRATQQPSSRAAATGSKVCPRCGKASSCSHMWERRLQPSPQRARLCPSGGNCCLHGDRKCYPSCTKLLALPVGWPGPHDTTL